MIVLLNTSTPLCQVTFIDQDTTIEESWQADRELAKGLLRYLDGLLKTHSYTWADIAGIGVFQGPGSFTGLRIGLTVMNTVADSEAIPIVGKQGDDWKEKAKQSLEAGENDKLVMPFYGSEAHITSPRK
jgi:tRNA threonylcarbamoyladenosine biosynthesis protein TsaB